MNTLQKNLDENKKLLKKLLPSEDILSYDFQTNDGVNCSLFYADGMVNKELLGSLVARPLSYLTLQKAAGERAGKRSEKSSAKTSGKSSGKSSEKSSGKSALSGVTATQTEEKILQTTLFPELKTLDDITQILKEVLDGNTLLLVDGLDVGFIAGAKLLPVRAVMEPPPDVAV